MLKFIEKIEKPNQADKLKEIKIFGWTVYRKSLEWSGRFVKRVFLNGLLVFQYDNKCLTFSLRLFDVDYFEFNILKTQLRYSYRVWYLFFFPIWMKNATRGLLDRYLKEDVIEKYPDYDDYYVIWSHTGEFFLFMHHFEEWVKRNKSKNYAMIVNQKHLYNIFKMFYPDIPIHLVSTQKIVVVALRGAKSPYLKFKGKNIYIPAYVKYFADVEKDIVQNNAHNYEFMKKYYGLSEKLKYLTISSETKEKIADYIKNNLGEKFVIISPESLSNYTIPKDFWKKLVANLKEKGYSVFCNVMNFGNVVEGSVTTFFTFEEVIELAYHSKAIIGLRSGFLDCVSQSNVPLYAIYSDFKHRVALGALTSKQVLTGFSLKKLPKVNPDLVYEYDINDYESANNLLEEIIKDF